MEVVGVVLGAVPIVIQSYNRLSKTIGVFRSFSKELKKLDVIVQSQNVLFQGDIIKLLVAVTNDEEKARTLLVSSKDEWEALRLPEAVDPDQLASLRETFTSWDCMLQMIHSSMNAICAEVENFHTSIGARAGSAPSNDGPRRISKRFLLCWKKTELQEAIAELRSFTADFKELTARVIAELEGIQTLAKPPAQVGTPETKETTGQIDSLEKYRLIRSASSRLYNTFALKWSCASHKEHAASISLFNYATSTKSTSREQGLKFDIETIDSASRDLSTDMSGESDDEPDEWTRRYQRLTVNHLSQSMHLVANETTVKALRNSLKEKLLKEKLLRKFELFHSADIGLDDSTKTTASATTHVDEARESISSTTVAEENPPITPDSMINLEEIEDICRHLQIPRSICSNTCIGNIEGLALHRFYLQSPQIRKSLAEIITWISEDEFRVLPRATKAHLASSLSVAILQYHSTPWLPDSWQSSNVRFFGVGELSQDTVSLTTPYFTVPISKKEMKGKGRLTAIDGHLTAQSTTPNSTASLARNELLFRFGIVLLELGYGQPWPRLRQRALAKSHGPNEQTMTDYHFAQILARAPVLRDRMGPKFSIIVRKCLGCDFGLG
ncbi:hypothetical protein B0H63DRAFT_551939 [Podospora didyma]|uniref:DUF7580 domain-containing protein n=1 Tax=Podospora didyma TaxID=330526 RepID=A0AAE0N416_9PEZI|nr:hypothetical protein B0H63DRAFT_551939 [Podospora didyma]